MKYENIDEIKAPSTLDHRIKIAIEEGYKKKGHSRVKNKWKKQVVAAAATVVIGTTALGVAFPTYAKDLPIIGNIFAYLSENKQGSYIGYKDYSKSLDMAQESNGVKITLNDAIYDGKTVMVTYTLESEKDLGDGINVSENLSIKGYRGGMAGSSGAHKVKENTYIGFTRMSIDEVKEELNVKLEFDKVGNFKDLDIKGNWDFKFNLKKTEGQNKIVNKSVEKEGVSINVEKITFTPMSTILHYKQQTSEEVMKGYHDAYIDLVEVKDDLGNVYKGEGNGGSGSKNIMNWSATYEKIDEKATKLIIKAKAEFSVLGEDGHQIIGPGAIKGPNKDQKILDYLNKKGVMPKEIILEDIVIDLK